MSISEERMQKLINKRKEMDNAEAMEYNRKKSTFMNYIDDIKSKSDRLDSIIDTFSEASKLDIVPKRDMRSDYQSFFGKRSGSYLAADGIYHKLGIDIYSLSNPRLAVHGGGANGMYSLIYHPDFGLVFRRENDNGLSYTQAYRTWSAIEAEATFNAILSDYDRAYNHVIALLKTFSESIDDYEKRFYNYIDELCE